MEARALLTVLFVTTTSDSGPGTLRQAILDSNATTGPNVIDFSIGGGGHQVITLASPLPVVTTTATIDGRSQGGFAGIPLVEINGNNMSSGDLLAIAAASCTVRGLIINNEQGNYALVARQTSSNTLIQGNYIGTDATGMFPSAVGAGVGCFGQGTVVGGTSALDRNVISGSTGPGFYTPIDVGTVIEGNYIGTNATGMGPIANDQGITVGDGAGGTPNLLIGGTTTGAGNVISGNTHDGIQHGGGGAVIQGNRIGTSADGLHAVPNGAGIGSDGDQIGGTAPGAGNLISGNTGNGVADQAVYQYPATIQGNLIGTDITGTVALERVMNFSAVSDVI